jgi:antirestriction protein ArdC
MTRPRSAAPSAPRQDLYARVTASIVADLEQGVRPWTKPWSAQHLAGRITRPLRSTGEPYKGVNVILLWCEAASRGFAAPIWVTFRQALAFGGHVRKGERGATVVYADKIVRTEIQEDGEEAERAIPFLKAYTVFNVEQVEGLPERFHMLATPTLTRAQRIAQADAFFVNLRGELRHGGDQAYYAVHQDVVQVPPFECFTDPVSYYATLAHEFTHWTRHPTRLDRDFGRQRFGDQGYAREELVAELGAAFVCADLGLELTPREDHAAYLDHWLKVLKAEPRFLFTAAAHAQKACDYLIALQPPGD